MPRLQATLTSNKASASSKRSKRRQNALNFAHFNAINFIDETGSEPNLAIH
jgi:hypothetical protein